MNSLIPFIETAGYIGVFAMIFAETGLLVGVVLPGDTLLFSVGLLAAEGHFAITLLIIGCSLAAIAGDSVGYWTGKKFGPQIFSREESIFFRKSYVARAQAFFERHGRKTIFLARYVPIVRTFTPVIAGVAEMPYQNFLVYNILGGIAWTLSILVLGYFFGSKIPNIDRYILPVILGVFVLSFIPMILELLRTHRKNSI